MAGSPPGWVCAARNEVGLFLNSCRIGKLPAQEGREWGLLGMLHPLSCSTPWSGPFPSMPKLGPEMWGCTGSARASTAPGSFGRRSLKDNDVKKLDRV